MSELGKDQVCLKEQSIHAAHRHKAKYLQGANES
jgi:hypothetical protein